MINRVLPVSFMFFVGYLTVVSAVARVESLGDGINTHAIPRFDAVENALQILDVKINAIEESLSAAKSLQRELKSEFEKLKSDLRQTDGNHAAVGKQHTQIRSVELGNKQDQLKTEESFATDGLSMTQIANMRNGHTKNFLYQKFTKLLRKRAVPETVAFSAYLSHAIDHLAPGQEIKCDRLLLNDGDAYNSVTGIFTVPLTGVYLMSLSIDSNTETHVMLVVDNANEVDIVSDPNLIRQEFETMSSNTILLRLNQGQSVWMEHYHNGDGSIISGDNWRFTTFSGVLLY